MKQNKINLLREIARAAHEVACAREILLHEPTDNKRALLEKSLAKLHRMMFRLVDKPNKLTFDDLGSFDVQDFKIKGREFECTINDKKYAGEFSVDVDLGEHMVQLSDMSLYEDLGDKYGEDVTDELLIEAVSQALDERIQDNAGEYEADAMGSAIDAAHDRMSDGD